MYIIIPRTVEKSLRIYSMVLISIGFVLIVLINAGSLFSSSRVQALFYPGGKEGGDFVNICGVNPNDLPNMTSWPTRSGAQCSFECNDSGCNNVSTICRCDEDEITTREFNGIVAEVCEANCKAPQDWGLGPNVSYSLLTSASDTDCYMWQVDTNVTGYRDGNPIMDWVVWKGRRIGDQSCKQQPEQNVCPYDSTEAKVKKTSAQNWSNSLTIEKNQTFNVGSFHNGSETYASDAKIIVKDPNNNEVLSCSTDNDGCNASIITASLLGTYTVTVKTILSEGTGFYPEAECNSSVTVTVTQPQQQENPNFTILKEVNDSKTMYKPGDQIEFKITIDNTGNTKYTELLFKDQFNPNHLTYLDIKGRRNDSATYTNLKQHVQLNDVSTDVKEIVISDITQYLGDLDVNQSYVILISFEAKPVKVYTTDVAIAEAGGKEKKSKASVTITYTQPPPTDT